MTIQFTVIAPTWAYLTEFLPNAENPPCQSLRQVGFGSLFVSISALYSIPTEAAETRTRTLTTFTTTRTRMVSVINSLWMFC